MKSVCAGESLQPSQAHFVAVCLLLLGLYALFTSSLLSLSLLPCHLPCFPLLLCPIIIQRHSLQSTSCCCGLTVTTVMFCCVISQAA